METNLIDLGKNIKTYRIEAGLSQEELSSLCGIKRSQLSRIESGEVLGVTYATIEKIFNSLGRTSCFIKIDEKIKTINIKPFVKWAGGKTQLLNEIEKHLPVSFNRYFEPFVGGGALLFKLKPSNFYINDLNFELICAYECFKDKKMFFELKRILEIHENNNCEEYFYKLREMDRNEHFKELPKPIIAARMIYLNKACFNGLFRVNQKGFFNVPFGKKNKVICYDRENFNELHNFFKNTDNYISNVDFKDSLDCAQKGDFVYFDPPYDCLDDKKSFTSYTKNGFNVDDQIKLFEIIKKLSSRGVYIMLSNHNTSFIRELYKDFHINIITAKRLINADPHKRGEIEEVLITNYE